MNDDDVIADLKQFIAATVTQATADLATKVDVMGGEVQSLRAEMNERLDEMDKRFDELNLKVDTIADAHAEELEDHEQRLARLESKTA